MKEDNGNGIGGDKECGKRKRKKNYHGLTIQDPSRKKPDLSPRLHQSY